MKKFKTLILIIIAFTFSGCATSTLIKEDAQKYKKSSIHEFLKERFLSKKYESSGLLENEYVIYSAPFTRMNRDYLYRPYDEVSLFCSVQNGMFLQAVSYKNNPMKAYIKNPYAKYSKVYHSLKKSGYSERVSRSVAFSNKMDAMQENSWLGVNTDGKVLQKAVFKDKIFGSFTCNKENEVLWAVNIIPIKFKPANPKNQLEPANLYISIGILQ